MISVVMIMSLAIPVLLILATLSGTPEAQKVEVKASRRPRP
jgi:hypothetical protein